VRASRARIQWDNVATSGSRWSPRQPQDLVQAVRDEQIVALNRPRQQNQFVVVGTNVTAPSAAGATAITVESGAGFTNGAGILIMLDSGVNFQTSVASTVGNVINIAQPLPFSVGTLYGDPIENSVIVLGP
jgi:hypothetical protein